MLTVVLLCYTGKEVGDGKSRINLIATEVVNGCIKIYYSMRGD